MPSPTKKVNEFLARMRQSSWLAIGTLVALFLAVSVLGGYLGRWDWVGLDAHTASTPQNATYQPPKTLWDWLQLLIVPAALAVGGYWFTTQQNRRQAAAEVRQRERDAEEARERREEDAELAQDKRRDDVLAAYFDRMSTLLLQHQLSPSATTGTTEAHAERETEEELEKPAVSVVARALTVSTLRQLDDSRNGLLLGFLRELGLLDPDAPVISLAGANLERVNLETLDLEGLDLAGAYLDDADLAFAYCKEVNLEDATLTDASFSYAHLVEAHLSGANLEGANFIQADLSKADLREANLTRATLKGARLAGADLRNARLEQAELEGADLEGADLRGATYTRRFLDSKSTVDMIFPTAWPAGFDPDKAGAQAVD
jgi:uncharacterized protein YjbI with pentapeptide repeats